ncbi:MAG: DegQ family serine endoprotease [Pseudomonadota bacterium]
MGPAATQTRLVPQSADQVKLSFAPIVREAAPAVVNVYATRSVAQRPVSPFFDDPFFRRFFGDQGFGSGAPRQRAERSLGSGVIIDPAGIIITNHHVIKGADAVRVVLSDKREFDTEIVLKDERTDLAVLKILEARGSFPAVPFADSDSLEVGDLVLAIGNPFGVGQTVTSGIVSALARTRVGVTDYQFFIQTDAAINPGNSGGALIDMNGALVGINTAIFSRSGGSNGIGFAIPANMVRVVVDSARTGGRVQRPWLGASLQAVTADIAESLALDRPGGALVTRVDPEGPAARADLRVGDLILAVDGVAVEDPNGFGYRFVTRGIGGVVDLTINRNGRERLVRIALEPAPDRPRDERTIRGRSPFSGAVVSNLSPALAEELGLREEAEGAIVTDIRRGSTAARVGFRPGDVVVEVNGRAIETTRDLANVASSDFYLWRIAIRRNGRVLRMTLGG